MASQPEVTVNYSELQRKEAFGKLYTDLRETDLHGF